MGSSSLLSAPWALRLYRAAVLSKRRWARLFGLTALSVVYLVRTFRQFRGSRLQLGLLLALAAVEAAAFATPRLLAAAVAVAALLLALFAASQPDDTTGHRAGAEGFTGEHCENTLEAVASLAQRERQHGPLPNFPYIEFDVQETSDGELVIFHDALLTRAFPLDGINASAVAQLEAETGHPVGLLTVQDLTLGQLRLLHLGGRRGLHVPTFRQFLETCIASRVQRSLAVEVKMLRTDAARQQFIDAISWYLDTYRLQLEADPVSVQHRHPHLGWAGVIAFPHLFAQSYGEYGSPQWCRWAAVFRERGINVRACHATWLSLIYGK